MKKYTLTLMVAGLVSAFFIGCGPSAEEKAAAEQHLKDSLTAVAKAEADSILAAQQKAMEDSLAVFKAMEDAKKAAEDSIAAAKANKPKPKPKPKTEPQPVKPEDVKPGQGRG